MMVKKTDEPKGGWLAPGCPDENGDCGPRVARFYADGTRMVRGKKVWKWKPITEAYRKRKERENMKREKARAKKEKAWGS
jgi:hypothetical protein